MIDKGTIDAVLSDESGNGLENTEQICKEVLRYIHLTVFCQCSNFVRKRTCNWRSLHCDFIDF